MPITINGIKVNSIVLELDANSGDHKIKTAEYSLISSLNKVLANQIIGGYGGIVLEPSPATKAALDSFIKLYVADVNALLGLS